MLLYTTAFLYIAAHKSEINVQVKKMAEEKLRGTISFDRIDISLFSDFPSIAVVIDNILVIDSQYIFHHHPFLQAEKISSALSIVDIMRGKNPLTSLHIKKASLYVFTDTSGYTNSYLLSSKSSDTTKNSSSENVNVEKVKMNDVRITFDNRKKNKLYDFVIDKMECTMSYLGNQLSVKANENILVNHFSFNKSVGSYLKNARLKGKFKIDFNQQEKQLSFVTQKVEINNQPFSIEGKFAFSGQSDFSLKVETANISYNFARSLVTQKLAAVLNIVSVDKELDSVKVAVSGYLSGGEPLVNAWWKCSKNKVAAPFATFAQSSFTGTYTNEVKADQPRNDENSSIAINDFSGIYETIPITSRSIVINDLINPVVQCDVKSSFQLKQLNELLQSNVFNLESGNGNLDVNYVGPITGNSNANTLINGSFNFADATLLYRPTRITIDHAKGAVYFKNTDVSVSDLLATVNGNNIKVNGIGKGLLTFLNNTSGKAFMDWQISSPVIDLGKLLSLFQQRNKTVIVNKKAPLAKTSAQIDHLVRQADFNLKVFADKVIFKKVVATHVAADLILANEDWLIKNIRLQHGGGSIGLSGFLKEKSAGEYNAQLAANLINVDINKVMYAFDDFGQQAISYQNLQGKLTSVANIKMVIDRNFINPPRQIKGFIDLSLKDGLLMHYEPLKKVQSFIFKNRNFDEIHFAEVKNRFDIGEGVIQINRFEIQSSVLTLFAEGIYGLDGKNTDISIQVPLKNLKKRNENELLKSEGTASKAGPSIFLRGKPGSDGQIQFKLDVFKKFRKRDYQPVNAKE